MITYKLQSGYLSVVWKTVRLRGKARVRNVFNVHFLGSEWSEEYIGFTMMCIFFLSVFKNFIRSAPIITYSNIFG